MKYFASIVFFCAGVVLAASPAKAEEYYCPESATLRSQITALKDYTTQLLKVAKGKKISWTHAATKMTFSYPAEWGYMIGWSSIGLCVGEDCKKGTSLTATFSNNDNVSVAIIADDYQIPEGIDGDTIATYLSYPITARFSDFAGFKQVRKITAKKYTAVILESTLEEGMTQFLKGDYVALVQFKGTKHSTLGFSAEKGTSLQTLREVLGSIK